MNTTVLLFLGLYFLAMLAVGVISMRRGGSSSMEGYYLSGRNVGPLVTAMTMQSTSMSGYMFLGAGSLGYTQGYYGFWYAAGDIGGGVVNLSVLGRRMRKLSQIMGALTSIEYLEKRYPSKWVRLIAAGLSVFLLGAYVLAQFIAGGKGLELVTGLPYELALTIAVAVILAYTLMGGYGAVAYTDLVQSFVMIIGIVWILVATLQEVGGLTAANEALAALDPTLLSIWGRDLAYEGQWGIVLGALLIFSIGYMGWPHVVTRHMAMRNPFHARRAGVYSTLWNLIFVSAPYILGTLAILVLPELDDPEQAIFALAQNLLPAAVVGIVMAAIMAAIMSTADSILLQTGSIAARDLYERFINPNMEEKQMVRVSQAIVLLLGIICGVIALFEPPAVFSIVVFTTAVLGSAFLPAYVAAVWWRKANTPGALASMIVGSLVAFSWQYLGLDQVTGLHPMLAGVVLSSLSMVVVSLLTQASHPVPEHVLRAMAETAELRPLPRPLKAQQSFEMAHEALTLKAQERTA
ncbi:sodium/proline symporter [Halomonas saccharevitans]|uniref:Sodium/proline symporter n=1 Tax=Halomonas saccharevitans TaxID=416872 RepID=A0A1I6Z5Y3_9GAMM|nr:sodium/proline symporter [Halomonas saccharevitans]SFT58095.1 sodium/proline symporter [Halomonas saccharevitans]